MGRLLVIASRQETIELNQRFEAFLLSIGAFALPKKKAFELSMRLSSTLVAMSSAEGSRSTGREGSS